MKRIVIILLLIPLLNIGQTQGPNNPGTTGNDASVGTVAWTNTNNALTSNNSYAVATPVPKNGISNYLILTNLGFSIPLGMNIDGIEIAIEKTSAGSPGDVKDNEIRLIKNGTIGGNNNKKPGAWGTADFIDTHGSPSDMWGLTLTPADVNASNFGVAISVQKKKNGDGTASIDNAQITVYYSNPLPITLLLFNGRVKGDSVQLQWITETEINNSHFIIEKSSNAKDYVEIGNIHGAGTTNTPTSYKFTDKSPVEGINYYKLKQVDFNGHVECFKPIDISYIKNGIEKFVIFPNPTTEDNINIHIENIEAEKILVIVTDILGNTYYSMVSIIDESNEFIAIDPDNMMASGVYNVIGATDNRLYNEKLIIKK